jgi:hypothetical protein
MCGRYTLTIDKSTIKKGFAAKFYTAQSENEFVCAAPLGSGRCVSGGIDPSATDIGHGQVVAKGAEGATGLRDSKVVVLRQASKRQRQRWVRTGARSLWP